MAVKKKYDRNVLGRGLDSIGTGKGRGLDALIDTSDVMAQGSSNLNEIAINMISPNPNQPRTDFDETALQELAASIKEIGIIIIGYLPGLSQECKEPAGTCHCIHSAGHSHV